MKFKHNFDKKTINTSKIICEKKWSINISYFDQFLLTKMLWDNFVPPPPLANFVISGELGGDNYPKILWEGLLSQITPLIYAPVRIKYSLDKKIIENKNCSRIRLYILSKWNKKSS